MTDLIGLFFCTCAASGSISIRVIQVLSAGTGSAHGGRASGTRGTSRNTR